LIQVDANLIKEFDASMETGRIIGFDINSSALTFGRVPPGSASKREIIITNDQDKPSKIILKIEGDIAQFVVFEENYVILQPQETKKINVFATAPLNIENEKYSGRVKVYALNP